MKIIGRIEVVGTEVQEDCYPLTKLVIYISDPLPPYFPHRRDFGTEDSYKEKIREYNKEATHYNKLFRAIRDLHRGKVVIEQIKENPPLSLISEIENDGYIPGSF